MTSSQYGRISAATSRQPIKQPSPSNIGSRYSIKSVAHPTSRAFATITKRESIQRKPPASRLPGLAALLTPLRCLHRPGSPRHRPLSIPPGGLSQLTLLLISYRFRTPARRVPSFASLATDHSGHAARRAVPGVWFRRQHQARFRLRLPTVDGRETGLRAGRSLRAGRRACSSMHSFALSLAPRPH